MDDNLRGFILFLSLYIAGKWREKNLFRRKDTRSMEDFSKRFRFSFRIPSLHR